MIRQVYRNRELMRNDLLKKLLLQQLVASREFHAENARVLDVEVCKGLGAKLWDKNGKEYLDFIAGQGANSAGHCHPKLIGAMQEQMCVLHHTTRSINNNVLPEFCQTICTLFNYDKVVVMNTGNESVELAVKLARIWGYNVKKICPKDAIVVFTNGNYWGCSFGAISASMDPLLFTGFKPLVPNMKLIPYDDPCSLEEILRHPNVCGFVTEPIQADVGVIVPQEGYLAEVRRLCTQNKVLWVCNEVMTGLGRTGLMLGADHECVKPDILCLGKSLSGGMYPVSATLASCEVMELLRKGSHHSTYAGNPLGARVASTMLKLIREDALCENATAMGTLFRDGLLCTLNKDDMPVMRGRGLLWAIKIDPRIVDCKEFCDHLRECGLLVWPCKEDSTILITPPLMVSEEEITQAIAIIKKTVRFWKGCHKICE
uniref:Ornithine aminotransferase n=1 Tax=Lygus hesperus TaxID=30085 RepID=A0A0A9XLR1_LYGHE